MHLIRTLNHIIFSVAIFLAAVCGFAQTQVGSVILGPPPNPVGPSAVVINPVTNKAYLFAGNLVYVIDVANQRLSSRIALPTPPPTSSTGAPTAAFVNPDPAKNKIYAFRGGQFVVIDGVSDSVVQTFALGVSTDFSYSPVTYNAANNRIYVGEISLTGNRPGETRVLNADTFATVAIIPSPNVNGAAQPSENPEQILVSPAGDRIFILYQLSGGQILDPFNNVIAQADCSAGCNGLAFPPGVNGAVLNPADKSVWVGYGGVIPGPPGGEDGANGFASPPFTVLFRVDLSNGSVTKPVQIFGQETEMLGFDPATGFLYMMATNLPTVPNPVATSPVIAAIETMLVVLDPTNLTATAADPSPMRRVTVDGTLLANTGTPFTCGGGVQAFEPIGLDLAAGDIYWRCDSTKTSFSSIVVSRAKFNDLGNVDYSQFAAQIQTSAAGQISAHAIPVGISHDFVLGANITGNHTALFWSASDNLAFLVDPVALAQTTIPLGAQPAGIALDPASHRAYVTDLTARVLTVIDTSNFTINSKAPAPGGSLIAANGANQYVLAGPSNVTSDPDQNAGAFLFDGARKAVTISLQGAATSAISVNTVTNIGYLADGAQWFAVDLATGARLFSASQLTPAGGDACQMTGISANRAKNQIVVAGQCAAAGSTLAIFDGATGSLISSVNVNAFMVGIGRVSVNPNTNRIYVEATVNTPNSAFPTAPTVEVFDGATLAHINSIADRKGPFAVNTVTNMVYSATSISGAAAIDGLAPEQSSFFGSTPVVSALAVDEVNNNVYLTTYNTLLGYCCTPFVPVYGVDAGTVQVFHQDPATYLVSGRVNDTTGLPLAGITITVAGQGTSVSQVTASNGIFAARFVPGTYVITPSNPSYEFSQASETITLGQIDQVFPSFTAIPIFHITGTVLTQAGAPVPGVTISATGVNGNSSAITDAAGNYSLAGLPAGTYTVTPVSPVNFYAPVSQSVQINKSDVTAPQFTVNPSLQITTFTLSANTIGKGSTATATVVINEIAPKGGVPITISSSDAKTIKPPTTFSIPAGSNSGSFTFSGSGTATVTLTATYSGALALQPSSASVQVNVAGQDTVHVTSATWSQSTQQLNVTATSTNAAAVLTVTLASNGQLLGTMNSQGNGTFTLQTQVASKPASINVKSSLGGSTGQGVTVVP